MRYALIQTQLLLFGLVAVAAYLLATRESVVAAVVLLAWFGWMYGATVRHVRRTRA
jgi:uncharacterized membrane protein YdfJ with MMPL/SSD domain